MQTINLQYLNSLTILDLLKRIKIIRLNNRVMRDAMKEQPGDLFMNGLRKHTISLNKTFRKVCINRIKELKKTE